LERCTVSVRSLCRALADQAGADFSEPVYTPDVRSALAGKD
jgi:hypothetical protein